MTPQPGRVPDYAAALRRLRTVRGPAAGQRCAECRAAARCWCYDGTDPNERRDPASGRRYSLDPDRYRPRCASCHRIIAAGHRPLDFELAEQAAALYEAGVSVREVAAQLGLTRPAIRTALAVHGVAQRHGAAVVDVEHAVALYEAGASVRAVASQLGVPYRALRTALAARGVDVRPRRAALDIERAAGLYEAGESLAGIAGQLGVTRAAVRAALAARGVTIRPPRSQAAAEVDGERAAAMYAAGASLRVVAARLGVTPPAVRGVLTASGVAIRPPRSRASAPVDGDRAGALYAAGASLGGIAAQLGVTRRAVRAELTGRGVAIRPPGPTRRHLPRPDLVAADRPRVIFQPFPTTSRQPSRRPTT